MTWHNPAAGNTHACLWQYLKIVTRDFTFLTFTAVTLVAAPVHSQEQGGGGMPMMERMQEMGMAMPDKAERPDGLGITILGSGGPMAMANRASAGYVIYRDKVPRTMVDGGGTFARLGEGRIFDLLRMDTWLFTHLHIDHSAAFPAIIKSMYFLRRGYNEQAPITIIGPDAWGDFPSTSAFVDAFFNEEDGVYRYLHSFLETVFARDLNFETRDLGYDYAEIKTPQTVLERDGMKITYIPVMHGPREAKTPAVAYRIDYDGFDHHQRRPQFGKRQPRQTGRGYDHPVSGAKRDAIGRPTRTRGGGRRRHPQAANGTFPGPHAELTGGQAPGTNINRMRSELKTNNTM